MSAGLVRNNVPLVTLKQNRVEPPTFYFILISFCVGEMVGGCVIFFYGVLFSLLFLWPPPRASFSSCVLLSFPHFRVCV